MSENLEINQNAAFGSHHNTFAGTVNNYGVPAENVAGMVIEQTFKLFHQYFPLLQKEALEEVHRMLQEKLKNIPQKILFNLVQELQSLHCKMRVSQKKVK